MALIVEDRIMETSTTTGTGAMTLAGAYVGYKAFSSVCTSPSDTLYYMIEAVDGSGYATGEWETGLGTYSAASTLTRTTVSRSSNANAAVSFSAGTKRVSISAIASSLGSGSASERTRVKPLVANFTLDNAGTATATDSTYGIILNAPATSANIKMLRSNTAPPATPYTMIVRVQPLYPFPSGATVQFALLVRNSTSGKIVVFGAHSGGATAGIMVQRYSSYTAFASTSFNPAAADWVIGSPWWKVNNDGTNLNLSVSPDGAAWELIFAESLASYVISVDQIGFGVELVGAKASAIFQSYEVV